MNAKHGDILQMLLDQNGIDVTELAKKADIPRTTLYSILKRNGTNTRKQVLQKICKALNVNHSIWNLSEEELTLRNLYGEKKEKNVCFSKESVEIALEIHHRNYNDLAAILRCIGIQYTSNELKNIVENQIPIKKEEGYIIEYVLMNNQLLTISELNSLIKFRELSGENKRLVETITNKIIIANNAEEEQLDEWINSKKE